MFRQILVNRVTELSTYAGVLLLIHPILPHSWLFGLGLLMIFFGDNTIRNFIGKFAPQFKAFIEKVGR